MIGVKNGISLGHTFWEMKFFLFENVVIIFHDQLSLKLFGLVNVKNHNLA